MKIKFGAFEFQTGKQIAKATSLLGALFFFNKSLELFSGFWLIQGGDSLIKQRMLEAVGATFKDYHMMMGFIFIYGLTLAVMGAYFLINFISLNIENG